MLPQPRSFLAHSHTAFPKEQLGKNTSADAFYHMIRNASGNYTGFGAANGSMVTKLTSVKKNASREETAANFLTAESSQMMVTRLPDQTQDDDSLFRSTFTDIALPKMSKTTSDRSKMQKQNKEHGGVTRSRDRSKPRTRKPKVPPSPGKAKLDEVELEQHVIIANGTEDIPIVMNITVSTRNAPRHSAVQVRISGLPSGSYLDKGEKEASSHAWLLQHEDLGSLLLNLPQHVSGSLPLIISSTLELQRNKTLSTRQHFDVLVRPETDFGQIEIKGPYSDRGCVDKSEKEIRFLVKVVLEDNGKPAGIH